MKHLKTAHRTLRGVHKYAIHHIRHKRRIAKELVLLCLGIAFILGGAGAFWVSSFTLPDLSSFTERRVTESTKIFDRTGKILLFDVHNDVKRKSVALGDISPYVKNATIAIEDADFYTHYGIKPTAILRAITSNLLIKLHLASGNTQGGSTITQQVIKNSLLTADKTATRKLKEWVLALKLERAFDKNTILSIYLNEAPYGGTIYGIEQASEEFFGIHASELTLAQSAYLAAMPQAPTFYSPFGTHRDRLDVRKNLVLQQMLAHKLISQAEYDTARKEVVEFSKPDSNAIKAPHFVFFIRDYLVSRYGEEAVSQNGLKVVTTLDYELQQKGEEIVKKFALDNKESIDAENAALVAIDPKNGQILTMIGSRDYFDKDINGNFNVVLARRQPGSSFKPFVYAEAFRKGYSPDTMLFDLPTEFSNDCIGTTTPEGLATSTQKFPEAVCYSPRNYDGQFRGPMTLRNALAQSINVPAIKTLYLAGLYDSYNLAKDMGIESLGDPNQYGLTLVLGGGEVTPLEMTSAYGVFADEGTRNPAVGILRVEDKDGHVLEEFQPRPTPALEPNIALTISDVLSDNAARAPIFGTNSALHFPGHDVAAKTGTTNDFKDMWIIGYTPNIVVGAWAGNNDGRPIKKENSARLVVAPMWNAFMYETFKKYPDEKFPRPAPLQEKTVKPALRGLWKGSDTYFVDKITGKLATEYTPEELRDEKSITNVHSILYWVNKDDPNGPKPEHPETDSQFTNWETPVRAWAKQNGLTDETTSVIPKLTDDVHKPEFFPTIKIVSPMASSTVSKTAAMYVTAQLTNHFPLLRIDYYLNNSYLGTAEQAPWVFTFVPGDTDAVANTNTLRAVVKDVMGNKSESSVQFGAN